MAEPDLGPVVLAGEYNLLSGSEIQFPLSRNITDVDKLQSKLPELPMQTRSRLNAQYGIILVNMLVFHGTSVAYALGWYIP